MRLLISQLHIQDSYSDSPSMFCFLETDLREQKKYEKSIKTSVDNAVNDLRYEIKFENRVKEKNNFFIKRNIAKVFLRYSNIF